MPGKPGSTLLANLAKTLNKLTGQGLTESLPTSVSSPNQLPGLPESDDDLHRLVEALERIATALEKLTTDSPSAETEPEDYWITLSNVSLPQKTIPVNTQSPIQPNKTVAKKITTPSQPTANKSPIKPPVKPVTTNGTNSTPLKAPPKNTVLFNYLKQHNITLQEPKKLTSQQQSYVAKLEKIALILGRNFEICHELYNLLKKNLVIPHNTFTYSLAGATPEQKQIIRQFCQLLKNAQLLETFSYQGKPDFKIELKATGAELNYVEGVWLEKYIKQEMERIVQAYLTQPGMLYEALPNPKIVFSDSSNTELDLFFALGKRVFCVEAKMKPNAKDLTDYLSRITPLKLNPKQMLIVAADISEGDCKQLTGELGASVIGINNFEQDAKAWLEAALR